MHFREAWAEMAQVIFRQVLRTDLDRPGFAHFRLGRTGEAAQFYELLRRLGTELAVRYARDFARELTLFEQGSFDQQVSTHPHRDGAPDESLLLLGYEPTTVSSRVFALDYTRAALDRGLSPREFLDVFNPLTLAGQTILEPYRLEVDFRPEEFQILAFNNGAVSWDRRHTGMLGVLHQADILRPDPAAARRIHSLILAHPD